MRPLARWSARTPVAANVLMALILVGGLLSVLRMRRELFPEFSLDMILISVPYPGASPEEVEEGICIKVEEGIKGIAGIKRITSTALENVGSALAELEADADHQKVFNDVKNAVDRIFTFPEEAEEPTVAALTIQEPAVYVAVYGDAPERVLRRIAENVRDDLTATEEISTAFLMGAREYEISIEVSEEALRRHNLSFTQVADAVRRWSQDLPAGKIKTSQGEILLRGKGRRYTGREYEDIPVVTLSEGAMIRLGQIATIVDGFEEVDRYSRFAGKRAVVVQVMRTASQDAIDVVDAALRYIEEKKLQLPEGIGLATCFDSSVHVRDRISLLIRNGRQGLILVFLALCLFLRWRLAFWVAIGIPVSFMGGFIILYTQGATINMISLFAFIMTLGIVVDDAIIVGENIYAHFRQGESPFRAAVEGAAEVGWPVAVSVLTTMVAFCPLFFVSGIMGKFIAVMPLAVIATLAISLLEAFLILPAHLKHSLESSMKRAPEAILKPGWRHRAIQRVIDRFYLPILRPALRWRYVTAALALASVIASAGLVVGGRLPFVFFPKFDSDYLVAEVAFPEGTSVGETEQAVERLEKALARVAEETAPDLPEGLSVVKYTLSTVGEISRKGAVPGASGSHVGEILVELLPTQIRNPSSGPVARLQRFARRERAAKRRIPAIEIMDRWREEAGVIPGVEKLTFSGAQAGPGGAPIEIRLLGRDLEHVSQAADELKAKLAAYTGVFDIRDDFVPGKWELKVKAKPQARTLGLTQEDIARQVRQGFYGAEALRIQRGSNELKVMVRYPESQRRTRSDVETMRIRTARNDEAPLSEVAEIEFGRGYSAIRRIDGRRSITVTADLDEATANAEEIVRNLMHGGGREDADGPSTKPFWKGLLENRKRREQPLRGFLPDLTRRHPGLSFDLEGQARETREALGSLVVGFAYVLIGIFCLLAAEFRSYIQPVIIMCAIPLALVGAFIGHIIMGMSLTIISLFGIVALAGVVVNDSLVLIDFINRRAATGEDLLDAVVFGGRARFRAIILTSITTVAGLAPLLFERSMQAQLLLPMAVSLAFGLAAATVLTLVVTPCLYLIVADVKRLVGVEATPTVAEEG